MSGRVDSLVGTRLPEPVCARCAHASGLLEWLEAALPPLPFAMCFTAAEERPGGILALPNGFLKVLVSQRYRVELDRDAASAGFEAMEIVVDPTVSVVPNEARPPPPLETPPPVPVREQPPGLTTRLFAERGFSQLTPLGPDGTRDLGDLRGRLRVAAGTQGACGMYEAMVFAGLLAIWGDGAPARNELATGDADLDARALDGGVAYFVVVVRGDLRSPVRSWRAETGS
jgi:hypothetical protein